MSCEEKIVISGIAGRFPESDNVLELQRNINENINFITKDERRWKDYYPDVPFGVGKINNITKFDATFFGILPKQANSMDPKSRMMLEHTFEALMDAGINPSELKGTNTGVFMGSIYIENELLDVRIHCFIIYYNSEQK
uniref:Beta-ketoacyl synthase-like N-terminal domain-containing protein n=1 Tax=Trichogramma kaykai TaxID=54128 RepID=A0ABD2WL10_9HYME